MTIKTAQRLQMMCDELWGHVSRASGTDNYEEYITAVRALVEDKSTSPAAWLHKTAQEMFTTDEADTVRPENFHDILGLIDNQEKAYSVLLSLPEEAAPEIERCLQFMLKDFLPSVRSEAQTMVKELPYKRGGGPKTSNMPSMATCREICEEIDNLHSREGIPKVAAQERMADKHKRSLRMIQRIWKDRKQYLRQEK